MGRGRSAARGHWRSHAAKRARPLRAAGCRGADCLWRDEIRRCLARGPRYDGGTGGGIRAGSGQLSGWVGFGGTDSGKGISRRDIADLLVSLLEKSLVIMDETSGRYRLLESIRDYGRALMSDS